MIFGLGSAWRPPPCWSRASSLAATVGASAGESWGKGEFAYRWAVWAGVCAAAGGCCEVGRIRLRASRGPDHVGVSDDGGLMGGVWPRRVVPSGELFELDPTPGASFLLALFSGIFNGGTARVSCTGSTMAVRPLAPRQPGRDDVKAPAAGSVLPSLAAAAFFAILRTLSPNDGGATVGLFCGDDHTCVVIPRPCP